MGTDRFLRQVMSYASQQLTKSNYQELDKGGGDRYGALEYVWVRNSGNRQCSIGISFSSLNKNEYAVEIWVGASADGRFGKRYVWACEPIREADFDYIKKEIEIQVVKAERIIQDWPISELHHFYLNET